MFSQSAHDQESKPVTQTIQAVAPLLRGLLGTKSGLAIVTSDSSDLVRAQRITTDLGDDVCVVEPAYASVTDQVRQAVASHSLTYGHQPRIVILPGKVVFAAGRDYGKACLALRQFLETLGISSPQQVVPDLDQETKTSKKSKQLANKVVVLAGAAYGFGLGIAKGLAQQGAHVVLADMNIERARNQVEVLVAKYGFGSALAVRLDVADEESQESAWAQIVATLGGIDVFISHAGITRTGSVTDQRISDFDLVTAVNYKGYFLSVRSIVPMMAAQHEVRPDLLFDIIDINSTFGLEGAKSNFSYLGSQAGAIGLSRSFALELISQGIKINTICPGNDLDGPLWSDPDSGLFVQYLRAGQVPGASNVAEVRSYFEQKVPMGRGCRPRDVVRAVLYLVEQQYETGQTLPVTGGRIMVN